MAENDLPRVIVDTNVLFSGIGRPRGIPAAVVAAIVPGRMLVGLELLAEYRRVLLEPRALDFLGLTPADVDTLLDEIRANALIDPGAVGPTCPDPDDQNLWDLLAGVPGSLLVTGERRLLESGHFPGRILTPREFAERYLVASR